MRAGRGYNNMGHIDKIFRSDLLSNIKITKYFNYEHRFKIKDEEYISQISVTNKVK